MLRKASSPGAYGHEIVKISLYVFISAVYYVYITYMCGLYLSFQITQELLFDHMLFYLVLFVSTHAILLFPKIGLCPFGKIGGAIAHIGCFHWTQSPVRSSAEYLFLPFRRSLHLITFLWRTEALEGLKVWFGQVATLIKERLMFHSHGWLFGCSMFEQKEEIECSRNAYISPATPWSNMLQGFQVQVLAV